MRKKLFAILMSAMMMVTFMPAMAFAATESGPLTWPDVLSVNWDSDYDGATLEVEKLDGTKVVGTEFIYVDATGTATGAGVDTYTLDDGDNWIQQGVKWYHYSNAIKTQLTVNVFDCYKQLNVTLGAGYGRQWTDRKGNDHAVVDAGDYSAWFANKDKTAAELTALGLDATKYAVTSVKFGDTENVLDKSYYTVTYPEYKAYSYAADGKDLTGNLSVALTDAGKTYIKGTAHCNNLVFVNDGFVDTTVHFDVDDLNAYYTYWDVDGFKGALTKAYDGKDHAVVTNAAENVAVTYAFKALDTTGTTDAEKAAAQKEFDKVFVDADFTETVPSIKNVGTYKIAVKFTLTKGNGKTQVVNAGTRIYNITPKKVLVYGKALEKVKTYDEKGFVITDEDFTIEGLCTGDQLILGAIETPADAGVYALNIFKDTKYATLINPNYDLGLVSSVVGTFKGTITKADNFAKIVTSNKTIKAGKSAAIKAYADFGTVKIAKVSSKYPKISVKGGKIVVKKGMKKGKYAIKVKAQVNGNANYTSAVRVKTVYVTVK